jgi:hypothetical protein
MDSDIEEYSDITDYSDVGSEFNMEPDSDIESGLEDKSPSGIEPKSGNNIEHPQLDKYRYLLQQNIIYHVTLVYRVLSPSR